MSKVEGGGPIDPPSRLRVTIFSRRLLGLNELYLGGNSLNRYKIYNLTVVKYMCK